MSDRRGLTSSPSPPMFSARRPCPSRPGVSAAVAHVDPARSLCLSTTGTTAGDPGRLPRIVSVVLRPAMLDSVVDDSLARVCRRAMRQSTSSEAYRAGSGPRRRAFLAEPPIRGVWAPIKSIALYFFQFAFRAHVADHRTPSFSPGSSRLSPSSPPLSDQEVARQVQYLLNNGWTPCIEFESASKAYADTHGWCGMDMSVAAGYYDNRYWVMWKLPMYGCTNPDEVLQEIRACTSAFPECFIRVAGFDNIKQVQCSSFLAHRPQNDRTFAPVNGRQVGTGRGGGGGGRRRRRRRLHSSSPSAELLLVISRL